jgi:hypothetical protein
MLIFEQRGAATRLRLSVATSAERAIRVIVPFLRDRFSEDDDAESAHRRSAA